MTTLENESIFDEIEFNEKFIEFYRMINAYIEIPEDERPQHILIHHPEVIGDNYKEIVDNLNLISATGASLLIIPPNSRG